MKLAVEISLYPLLKEYISEIEDFILRLNQYPELNVVTNAMSTQVCGDYDSVMQVLHQEMKVSHQRIGKSIFVCKFLNSDITEFQR